MCSLIHPVKRTEGYLASELKSFSNGRLFWLVYVTYRTIQIKNFRFSQSALECNNWKDFIPSIVKLVQHEVKWWKLLPTKHEPLQVILLHSSMCHCLVVHEV